MHLDHSAIILPAPPQDHPLLPLQLCFIRLAGDFMRGGSREDARLERVCRDHIAVLNGEMGREEGWWAR